MSPYGVTRPQWVNQSKWDITPLLCTGVASLLHYAIEINVETILAPLHSIIYQHTCWMYQLILYQYQRTYALIKYLSFGIDDIDGNWTLVFRRVGPMNVWNRLLKNQRFWHFINSFAHKIATVDYGYGFTRFCIVITRDGCHILMQSTVTLTNAPATRESHFCLQFFSLHHIPII